MVGSIATNAPTTAAKLTVLIHRAGATPAHAITRPASPGPIRRAALNDVLLRPTALLSRSGPTISEAKAWRVGTSKAWTTPPNVARTNTCHNWVTPNVTSSASAPAMRACSVWVIMSSFRFSKRSATAPAIGDSTAIGRNCKPVTSPSTVAECGVRIVRTNQSWATRFIQVPIFDANEPLQKYR